MDDIEKEIQEENSWKSNFAQLQIVNKLRTHQDQLSWTIFNIFWAANAVLLVALFQNTNDKFLLIKWIFVPVVGILFSFIWAIMIYRTLAIQIFYEGIVEKLEIECKIQEKFQTTGNNFIQIKGIRVKPIMRFIPIIGIVVWIVGLIFSIIFNFRG